MQYSFKLRFAALLAASALCTSGCGPVSETPYDTASVTVIEPASETVYTTAESSGTDKSVTEISVTDISVTAELSEIMESTVENLLPETETASEIEKETELPPETAEKVSETDARIPLEAARANKTEALTLQYESPAETTASKTETASETQSVSVSRSVSAKENHEAYSALNFKEQKGFWITYLEYASILRNKSEKSFRKSIGEYFDNISELGFNTVYVQVRAFGDAYYDSELFPSGEQFDGTIGTKNCFDALEIMVDCAHDRGLSIHAWVNPMRLMTTAQLEKIGDGYTIKKWYKSSKYNGKYIVKSGDRWYLNPAYDEVTDLIADGISEITERYRVDGIQIDDYFYPTTDKSFDKSAYAASGTKLSLSDWRISNVNNMVKKLYSAAHKPNSSVVFGISPQGSVENNYSELYADVKTWCSESGYCDYILPQVYFGFESTATPYADITKKWNGMVKNSDVKLVIGLAAYKIGAEDKWAGSGKREWLNDDDIIARQMKSAKKLDNYGGVAIYRYDSLFNPEASVAAQVNKELKNIEK